jgi:hypothetical protein
MLVVPEQGACAGARTAKLSAASDLVRQEVQAVGRVDVQMRQGLHSPNFRRNSHEMTTVERELLHVDEAFDCGRQSDDLRAFRSRHPVERRKFLLTRRNGLLDAIAKMDPGVAMNVLLLIVEDGSAWLPTGLGFRNTTARGAWPRRSDRGIGCEGHFRD